MGTPLADTGVLGGELGMRLAPYLLRGDLHSQDVPLASSLSYLGMGPALSLYLPLPALSRLPLYTLSYRACVHLDFRWFYNLVVICCVHGKRWTHFPTPSLDRKPYGGWLFIFHLKWSNNRWYQLKVLQGSESIFIRIYPHPQNFKSAGNLHKLWDTSCLYTH